jgi:hypothetical protein
MPQPVAGKPRCAFVTPERGEKGTSCLVDAGILRKDFLKILFTPLGGTCTGVVLSPVKSCSTGSGCGFRTVRRAEAWDYFASACSRSASVGDFPGEASAAGVERVAPRALLPAEGKPCSPHRSARGATRSTVHPAPLTSSLASTLSLKPLLPANPCGTGRGCEIRAVRRAEARDYFASACSHSARVTWASASAGEPRREKISTAHRAYGRPSVALPCRTRALAR